MKVGPDHSEYNFKVFGCRFCVSYWPGSWEFEVGRLHLGWYVSLGPFTLEYSGK